jgi:NAD(P)-dependent dehydrogenase (short-subunit alcohol dehydrogenase family)
MSGRLAGKQALVTGGAQGIGAAISLALAREGARVLVSDRNAAGAEQVAARINLEVAAGAAFAAGLDVTREQDWVAGIELARQTLGGLSILVNNAGVATMGTIEQLSLDAWRRTMAINAEGPFLGCKYTLPLLREQQPASIVNMSSVAGLVASHNMTAYNASKSALWMLTKSVALYCARNGWNIRCNSVHPTFVRTQMLQAIIGDREESEVLAKLSRQVPLGRIAQVDDVTAAVVYLASDESAMMTGAELKLDGGLTAM